MITDIHTHILHDIDDGPENLNAVDGLLRCHLAQATHQLVATPHFNLEKDDINHFVKVREVRCEEVQSLIKKKSYPITLKLGAELYFSPQLATVQLDDLVIEGTDYLLIELPTQIYPSRLKDTLRDIISNGYTPILAHIERYPYLLASSDILIELIEMGVLIQMNAATFVDAHQQQLAKMMLKKDLVHLIASDAHNCDRRAPNLSDLQKQYFGTKLFENLQRCYENAQLVFKGECVVVHQPRPFRKIFGRYL
ncbi:hypothetical protein G7061_07900 [Erysipelothrix sp. HDW6B]|uniref:tyrosine-protein phosphatase n=1 Tax=Erysipelothrix TaxID=1647 RepID=UPI00140C7A96|nr:MULTISPECIES: CpsB/CapC family capsule biosynthesis tyrosine phosphatase [Erysipelothrix]QIK86536.1 hypothetical protein G7061_07900 [Erysipelothrix sp. HDW6B]